MPKDIIEDDNSICSSDDDIINNVDLQSFLKQAGINDENSKKKSKKVSICESKEECNDCDCKNVKEEDKKKNKKNKINKKKKEEDDDVVVDGEDKDEDEDEDDEDEEEEEEDDDEDEDEEEDDDEDDDEDEDDEHDDDEDEDDDDDDDEDDDEDITQMIEDMSLYHILNTFLVDDNNVSIAKSLSNIANELSKLNETLAKSKIKTE